MTGPCDLEWLSPDRCHIYHRHHRWTRGLPRVAPTSLWAASQTSRLGKTQRFLGDGRHQWPLL